MKEIKDHGRVKLWENEIGLKEERGQYMKKKMKQKIKKEHNKRG